MESRPGRGCERTGARRKRGRKFISFQMFPTRSLGNWNFGRGKKCQRVVFNLVVFQYPAPVPLNNSIELCNPPTIARLLCLPPVTIPIKILFSLFIFFILPPISNMTSSLFLTESSDSRLHTLHSHVGHLLLSLTFLFIPSTRRIPPGVGGTATQEFLPIKTSICQLQFSCVQFRFALDVHVSLHRLLSPPGLAPVDDKNYVSISDSFTVVEFVEKMTSISIVNGNSRGS